MCVLATCTDTGSFSLSSTHNSDRGEGGQDVEWTRATYLEEHQLRKRALPLNGRSCKELCASLESPDNKSHDTLLMDTAEAIDLAAVCGESEAA
ncbi:hypothetical protein UY3_03917 [Chelonia mydas]|uniref:Uncharacterized protein n=1 Tax=Chelonia mydas TaxID=8469 RepID=M7CDL9_CHEMY|nr:hypothetical protein UY3_03917 [Chelonia mydas]